MRFWDTSAIVPLFVGQVSSPVSDLWIREDPHTAIWTLTDIEILSALHRLFRQRELSQSELAEAERRAGIFLEGATLTADLAALRPIASRVLRTYDLRAADALQLAAALLWAEGSPTGRVFHTFDRRLATAAMREGFTVPQPPQPPA